MPNPEIKYEEFGTNYRFFLRWRYAVVLGAGAIDFTAFQITRELTGGTCEILFCKKFLISILFLLMLFELRTTNVYRDLIKTASKMEKESDADGYYTLLETYKGIGFNGKCYRKLWYMLKKLLRNWFDVLKGLGDLVKPSHTGVILWFIIASMAFVWHLDVSKSSEQTNDNKTNIDLSLNVIEAKMDRIEGKLDSVLRQEKLDDVENRLPLPFIRKKENRGDSLWPITPNKK